MTPMIWLWSVSALAAPARPALDALAAHGVAVGPHDRVSVVDHGQRGGVVVVTPVIDGIEGQLSLAEDALTDELSLLVTDAGGPVYLLEAVGTTVLTTEAFGPTFVEVGADLGTVPVGLDHLRLYSASFQTDDGPIEVFPGEPVLATIDGSAYRIVLVASWVRERSGDRVADCYQLDEVLSYELVRVTEGEADLQPLVRPEAEPIDGSSCGM